MKVARILSITEQVVIFRFPVHMVSSLSLSLRVVCVKLHLH